MKALIDADSLIYSCSYNRTPDEAIQNFHNRLDEILEETGANKYALFLTQGKTFRHNVTNSYKDNRPRDMKHAVFYYVKYYLLTHPAANYQNNVEADDLVTYWADKLTDVIVCSPDKDVIYSNTRCYNYNKKEITENTLGQIERFFWKQMLMGDSSDNIKGIPGVGPKGADKILEDSTSPRNDVYDTYVNHFGLYTGTRMFYINFKQLYLLRTDRDFQDNDLSIPSTIKTVEVNEIQTL